LTTTWQQACAPLWRAAVLFAKSRWTGFMLNGNLVAGASRRGLLLRVGKDRQIDALAQPGARPMVMRGRTMEGYIYVDPPALNDPALQKWLRSAVAYVQTLPQKKVGAKPQRTKAKRK
jgi:TfoX/Sxy family transcriptional regulator of competence genes